MSRAETERCELRRAGELMWTLRVPVASPRLLAILENPERALESGEKILKSSAAVTVWRDEEFVLKRWVPCTIGGVIKDLLRPSYARRAFAKARRLEAAGIATARPLAAADRRKWGVLRSSYFIMEGIRGAFDLGSRQKRTADTAREVARLLGGLHQTGFTHRDLKPTNLLFDHDGRAYLIDLDGLNAMVQVPDHSAIGDLSKLARRMIELATLSPEEATSFLTEYCRIRVRENRRWWWREIRSRMATHQAASLSRQPFGAMDTD